MKEIKLNIDAEIKIGEETRKAKDILCENKDVTFITLDAAALIVKSGIWRPVLILAKNIIEYIITKTCETNESEK